MSKGTRTRKWFGIEVQHNGQWSFYAFDPYEGEDTFETRAKAARHIREQRRHGSYFNPKDRRIVEITETRRVV